jgi:hypothetical protein
MHKFFFAVVSIELHAPISSTQNLKADDERWTIHLYSKVH